MNMNITEVVTENGMSRRRFFVNSAGMAPLPTLPTPLLGTHNNELGLSPAEFCDTNKHTVKKYMSTITTKDGTQIYYKDWGTGQPIVFSHGWPLSADDWDAQMLFFLNHGYRVIAHDRRGHGRST